MFRRFSFQDLIFTAALLFSVSLVPDACVAQITVQLRPDPVVGRREVLLSDVAFIRTDSQQVASSIGQVDVAIISDQESVVTLRKSFVKIRLMLAGWRTAVVVEGPESIAVTYAPGQPVTDQDIERAAEETLRAVLDVDEGDLRVRLASPFMQSLPTDVREKTALRVDVLSPLRPSLGQTSMTVRLWDGHQQVAGRMGRFEVLKRHRVAVTRVSLQRDNPIEPKDIQFENRFLAENADEPAESELYGLQVRSPISPGQIVSLRDLSRPPSADEAAAKQIVIKARDKITATALSGALRVQLARAEAMQDGRMGDTINVRNLDSGRVFSGRVVNAGEVEIRLR